MKYLIASDIHGSAYYCEKLISAFEKERADRLILLGDILYHGPRNDLPKGYDPKTVIPMLNALKEKILCVRGNCDAQVDQMVLSFPVMADYAVVDAGERLFYLTHGHIFHIENLPPLQKGDILIYGHTHVPLCEEKGGVLCLNPGSVSLPKNGTPHSYIIFENGVFYWKDLDGEEYRIFREY